MVSEKEVWDKLKTVMDPEMQINLVDLGLIYKVTIVSSEEQTDYEEWMKKGDLIKILMTLTSIGCPLAGMFDELVGGRFGKYLV